MKYIAQGFSFLIHPLLVPVYIVFFIFNVDTVFSFIPRMAQYYCYLVTVLVLLFIPLASLPLFRYFKMISSYDLGIKQERVYPILVAVGFTFLGFWLIGRVPYTNIVQQLYLVVIILLSVFSIITIRWKMSMHMTAIGAACGFLLILGMKYSGDVRLFFMGMLLLSGILASCRLYLKQHNPLQVYVGFLFGLCFVVGILF